MEITFVGMYAETSPACVSMMGRAVMEPPPYSGATQAALSRIEGGSWEEKDIEELKTALNEVRA